MRSVHIGRIAMPYKSLVGWTCEFCGVTYKGESALERASQ
jgi:hypothetical protein